MPPWVGMPRTFVMDEYFGSQRPTRTSLVVTGTRATTIPAYDRVQQVRISFSLASSE